MKKTNQIDMTQGKLMPQLISFTLPLMLSGIIQLLFNAADIVVVGQFAGEQSLAAVGSTGSLVTLIVNLFIGISSGTGAVIARHFGAHDDKRVSDTVHTAIAVALAGGVLLSIVGLIISRPALNWMDCPENVIDKADTYLKIYFLGMPFLMLYNFGASALRAVGDTKRPLYFLSIAGVVNVCLNLITVICFQMDVAGVAIATVASQVVSSGLVALSLIKTDGCCRLDLKMIRVHWKELKLCLGLGLPAGLQSVLFSISNVQIQSSVNSFGDLAMAGNTAASNLEGFAYTAMNSVHHTAMTFASQNYGAGNIKRMKQVLPRCLALVTFIGVILGGGIWLFKDLLLRIYTDNATALSFGAVKLTWVCLPYVLCGIMETVVGQIRGMGCAIPPMINSLIFACAFRVFWVVAVFEPMRHLFTELQAFALLMASYPISWLAATLIHLVIYYTLRNKYYKRVKAI
ncbi:MAG: MATE family efflux transporter [Ruminococcaceae bacterium]|nr:MATE family efflux transporter [Oscillospiraceae bacterium]